MSKNPNQKPKLKGIVRKHIQSLAELKSEITNNPKLEFGFVFNYPKGFLSNGKPKGIGFQVTKLKKKRFIEIGSKIVLAPEHIKVNAKKNHQFFDSIVRIFLMKNVSHFINYKDNSWVIANRIYLNDNHTIPINLFYNTLNNLLNSNLYAIHIISSNNNGIDFNGDRDLSFYT